MTFSTHFTSSCFSSGTKMLSNRLGSEGGSASVFEVTSGLPLLCDSSRSLVSVPVTDGSG
jgi:hypothetical protein